MRKTLVFLFLLVAACRADEEYEDDWEQPKASRSGSQGSGSRAVFTVEHSLGSDEFSPRTTLAIVTSKLSSEKTAKFLEPGKISSEDVAAFKHLVKAGGFYRIRVRSDPNDASSPYVMAALPACQLLLAGFKEKLVFRFDLEGSIAAIEYANPHFPGDCVKRLMTSGSKSKGSIRIRSAATIAVPEDAPSPPLRISGNMFVKGAEQIIAGDKKPAPQKSFFQKYWHIIVPVGVLFMLSNALAPPPPQGGGGGDATKQS